MNNLKTQFSIGTLIALLAIIGLIYWVANREPASQGTEITYGGHYTITNDQFGYKFDMPDKYFVGYQEHRQGYATQYLIPTEGISGKYTPVFSILATPKEMAQKFKQLCAQDRQTAPVQCTDFDQSDGQNNQYYFNIIGSQDSELLNGSEADLQKLEEIHTTVKKGISYFDVMAVPETLTFSVLNTDGYEYSYPAELDRTFEENQVISLPVTFGVPDWTSVAPGIVKIIPVRYCGPSGQCQNSTTNFSINVGLIDFSEQQLLSSQIGPDLIKSRTGGSTIYTFNQGAEGEGINYNFVILPIENKILVVAHKYIDETVVTNYANERTFTSYDKQKNIVSNIIESLNYVIPR